MVASRTSPVPGARCSSSRRASLDRKLACLKPLVYDSLARAAGPPETTGG